MKIFGSNDFLLPIEESSTTGAWIARQWMYKNLLRYGSFDEYHFFVLADEDIIHPARIGEYAIYKNDKRVKFINRKRLPDFLKNTDYTVFFHPGIDVYSLLNLRTAYAKKYYPVCGLTYAICYQGHLTDAMLNIICRPEPFDSIVCISEPVLKAMRQMYGWVGSVVSQSTIPRFDHLPLGINVEDFSQGDKEASRKHLNLPADKTIILHFGRFSIYNKADLQPLLVAFKHLLSLHDDIMLVLAGSDAHEYKYGKKVEGIVNEMGISDHVRFFFEPTVEDKHKLYSASDIFTSVSDNLEESFGLTLLEASASGLPAVVSHWDGYKDLVVHNETGFHIPTYWIKCDEDVLPANLMMSGNAFLDILAVSQSICVDPKKMIEYLSALISNKDLRMRMGAAARDCVLREYDWSVIIPKYEKLWLNLSDIAKTRDADAPRKPIFQPNYFKCFSHYPTLILDDSTNVALTEEGISLLKTKKLPSGQPPFTILTPQIVFIILFFLCDRQRSSIGELTRHVQGLMKDAGREMVGYHIMWMLKKYLLEKI